MYKHSFNVERVTNDLIEWTKNWFKNNGNGCNAVKAYRRKRSAICAALCVKALGQDRVN